MSVVLIGIALIPLLIDVLIPAPLSYRNTPFPVCRADSPQNQCVQPDPDYVFHTGDVVPLLIDRCYIEPFLSPDARAGYRLERSLVSDHDGITITIAPTFNTAPAGCQVEVSALNAIPSETPTGVYHFEGASTLYGTFRTVTVVWRSKSFKVDQENTSRFQGNL